MADEENLPKRKSTYNSDAYLRRKAKGLCGSCAKRPAIKKIVNGVEIQLSQCQVCKENSEKRKNYAKTHNLCIQCMSNPPIVGFLKCEVCRDKQRRAAKTSRMESSQSGLCGVCKEPVSPYSKSFCEKCLKKHNETNKRDRAILKEKKICRECRRRPVIGGLAKTHAGKGGSNHYCKECMAKLRARKNSKKNLESGRAWSKFRKKKGTNENPIYIRADALSQEKFEESFGVFDDKNGKLI